jgi:hypothetical protein
MTLRHVALAVLLLSPLLHAQRQESALSESEVEKLRDVAAAYPERVLLFTSFLDDRAKAIQTLTTGRRHAGREEDIHDQFEQFASIADDLEDNLEDYGPRHRDLRKALPKLLAATDRWLTAIKTPPSNEAYEVSRRLALESVNDIKEDVSKLIEEQKTWFAAHPPPKSDKLNPAKPE